MKIFEIGTGYTPIPARMGAATEIVVEELTKTLLKQGHDVTILDIKSSDRLSNSLPIIEVPVPKIFTGTDVQLGIMHKLKRVFYSVSLAGILKKMLKDSQEKIIIHFHNQYNMYFFLKLVPESFRKKCFIAYTNHSYIWHGAWDEIEKTVKKRYFQEITCMEKADRVYVLNDNAYKNIVKYLHIHKNKIQIINNGVNTEVYTPLPQSEIDSFKAKCGFADKKIFTQIGSVCERKNQLGAVKLLLPFLKRDSSIVFTYAGGIISEEYQQEILNFVKEQGIQEQVCYLGEVKPGKELNKYYNIADAMVFPSKSEGFSLVIIEALAAGIPVFVNRQLQFKLSGSCLQYSDDQEFNNLMENQILNFNILESLSTAVRKVAVEQYAWGKVAQDYLISWKL